MRTRQSFARGAPRPTGSRRLASAWRTDREQSADLVTARTGHVGNLGISVAISQHGVPDILGCNPSGRLRRLTWRLPNPGGVWTKPARIRSSQTIADSEFRIVKIPKLSVWGFWLASIFLFAAAIELIFFIGVLFVVDFPSTWHRRYPTLFVERRCSSHLRTTDRRFWNCLRGCRCQMGQKSARLLSSALLRTALSR